MSSTPVVSVVVPTYNQPALLRQSLETVFAQTFRDFEIVVVNDGSTDTTGEVLEELARTHGGLLRVITQENRGIGAARNRGIDESRGQYVALLDHDDLWLPEKLQTQVDFMRAHAECSACTVRWAFSTDPQKCAFNIDAVPLHNGMILRPLHVLAEGHVFLISSSILFDRARAARLRYENRPKCIEDTPFQIGLFERGEFGIAGDRILMVYRLHAANYSGQALFFANGIRLLRELETAGRFSNLNSENSEDLREFLAHVGRTAAVRQLLAGMRLGAAGTYLREWKRQLAAGRGKFLGIFPFLLLTPRRVLRRKWQGDMPRAV